MKKKLIVIADNSLIVEAIRSGLRESGAFDLLGYTDAYKATARLIEGTGAEVVLLDEADQSERALGLIRSIRETTDRVGIIVLAVHLTGQWLHRAFEAGATGAISKAVHPAALATLVREALNGHIVHPLSSFGGEKV
jgi:DNA-binding NarL/FixJ family response regulator